MTPPLLFGAYSTIADSPNAGAYAGFGLRTIPPRFTAW